MRADGGAETRLGGAERGGGERNGAEWIGAEQAERGGLHCPLGGVEWSGEEWSRAPLPDSTFFMVRADGGAKTRLDGAERSGEERRRAEWTGAAQVERSGMERSGVGRSIVYAF